MSGIIEVCFKGSEYAKSVYGLTQYDFGRILQIIGLNLAGLVQVHFSLQEAGGEAEIIVGTVVDGVLAVPIPSFILSADKKRDYEAYAFVYPCDEESGQTERKLILKIRARPRPSDWVPSAGPAALSQVLELLNQKITNPLEGNVGQALVVAAVDENGRPIKYKNADIQGEVDVVDEAIKGDMRAISSNAVYVIVGDIDSLLEII